MFEKTLIHLWTRFLRPFARFLCYKTS